MHAGILCAICVLVGIASAAALDTSASIPGPDVPVPTSTAPPPPGYKFEAATGSSYKFSNTSNGWDDAKTTCERDGAHLLIVNDAEEANIIAGIARGFRHNYGWAGLTSNIVGGEKVWNTIQGEPLSSVFHDWHPRYTTRDLNRSCGGYSAIFKQLFDRDCNVGLHFICEISH